MFEYMNYGALGFILLFILLTLIKPDKFLLGLEFFVLVLVLSEAFSSYSDAQENMAAFTKGAELHCTSGGGMYARANHYLVSKSDGWKLEKHSFLKESLLLSADRCSIEE